MHKAGIKLLFICTLIVMLLSISAVSAEYNDNITSHIDKQTQISNSVNINDNTHKILEDKHKKNIKHQNTNTYYVSSNGTSDNDGTTSSKAVDIETGFNKLTSNTNSKIIINQGTYNINKTVNINKTGNYQITGNGEVIFNTTTRTLNIETGTVNISNINFINSYIREDGGAIKNNGTLTITNTTFNDNTAFYQKGGAIYNTGNLTITNSTFNHNIAQFGGAIYNDQGHMSLENNTFTGNTIENGQSGGAIYNNNAETNITITIKNNYFTNNSCDFNGGGVLFNNGSAIFTDNYVEKSYGLHGGAIYSLESIIITNNTFINNTSANGPVIYSWGLATLNNNTIINNKATTKGGAVYNMEDMILVNNTITNNTAPSGGAIYNALGTINMTGNIITQNNATNTGGAIYNQATINMNNNTLTNNTARNGSAIYNIHKAIQHISPDYSSTFTMRFHGNMTLENNTITDHIWNTIENTGEMRLNNNTINNNEAVILNNNTDEESEESGLIIITDNQFNNNHVIIINDANTTLTSNTINNTIDTIIINNKTITVKNNTYTSCNIETTTDTKLENQTLNNTNYKITININTKDPIYNTKINNGEITTTINNKQYKQYKVENGQATITIPKEDLPQTTNNIIYTYTSPDKSYQTLTLENTITTIKHNTYIQLNPINNTPLNEKINITGTLKDANNTGIQNKTIDITVNNKNYNTTTDTNGQFTLNTESNTIGTNNITVKYTGDNAYNKSDKTATFNMTKMQSIITATSMTGYLGSNVILNATIKDADGNTISNGIILIKINNKTLGYTNITNNGKIEYKLYLDPYKYGKEGYNITFVYGGTDTAASTRTDTRLNVIPFNPAINLTVSPADMGDTVTMTVKVTNGHGYNALSGNIRFKINGLTYKVNKKPVKEQVNNGTAVLRFYASKKFIGNNNITILYSGNGKFDSTSQVFTNILTINAYKQTILTTQPVTAKLGRNITISAKITDKNQKPLTQGIVAIKINGKTFGHANITYGIINYTLKLDPTKFSVKNYTITIKFGGKGKYSPATVNTTLTINKNTPTITYNKITVNNKATARITATIKDGNLNANNGTVGLKINGKTYKINGKPVLVKPVNGIAIFNVSTNNLPADNNITFTYSGDRIFNGGRTTINNGLKIKT